MTQPYDAVVYDLDGTLARLRVNWGTVRDDVATALRAEGVDPGGASLWELLEQAETDAQAQVVEETIAEHEREGARQSTRLRVADELPREVPVGVCSLNCEAACRIALETHDLDEYVESVVGRDTVETHKPDPLPLLHTIEQLGVDPEQAVFIGDSRRDAVTAERAGVDFEYVADR